jgi:pimeloyl-ACP methyl ester carboxylesterase
MVSGRTARLAVTGTAREAPALRPAVLLLHGQPGSARDWHRVIAALGDHALALPINRPGWNGQGTATDLEGNVRAAMEALDRHSIERAIVVGHSYGAAIAAMFAILRPDRARGLVLASPAANRAALTTIDRLLAAPVVGPAATVTSMAGLGVALGFRPGRRAVAARLGLDGAYLARGGRALLNPRDWRSFVIEQRALIRELADLERRLPEIAIPTRIVSGSADTIVPVAAARLLARQIPAATLEVLEGAWHLLPQRHPGQLADAILATAQATA